MYEKQKQEVLAGETFNTLNLDFNHKYIIKSALDGKTEEPSNSHSCLEHRPIRSNYRLRGTFFRYSHNSTLFLILRNKGAMIEKAPVAVCASLKHPISGRQSRKRS